MASRRRWIIGISAIAFVLGDQAAFSNETKTFSYDALGRLVQSTASGGPNSGWSAATCLDAAGNRTSYFNGTGTPPTCSSGPTPTSGNHPPVTQPDSASLYACTIGYFNVVANDSDPDGDPITLISVSGGSLGSASVYDGANVKYTARRNSGTDTLQYTIQDSHGATATGTLTVTVLAPCDTS